jgi:hypothetical protein
MYIFLFVSVSAVLLLLLLLWCILCPDCNLLERETFSFVCRTSVVRSVVPAATMLQIEVFWNVSGKHLHALQRAAELMTLLGVLELKMKVL